MQTERLHANPTLKLPLVSGPQTRTTALDVAVFLTIRLYDMTSSRFFFVLCAKLLLPMRIDCKKKKEKEGMYDNCTRAYLLSSPVYIPIQIFYINIYHRFRYVSDLFYPTRRRVFRSFISCTALSVDFRSTRSPLAFISSRSCT